MNTDGRTWSLSVIEIGVSIIAVISVLYVLSNAASVAIPFMLAFLLSMLFYPIIRWGKGKGIPTIAMVLVVMFILGGIFLPLGILLNSRLQILISILPSYYVKLVEIGQGILSHIHLPDDFWDSINWYNTIGRYIPGMTGFMFRWLGTTVMTLVFLFFMLLESPTAEGRLRTAFDGRAGDKAAQVGARIVDHISKYIRTLAVISFATGCCVCAAMKIIGVDFAVAWGALAFFLNFIPTIGSIAASIPPILVAVVQFYPSPGPVLLTAVSLLAIQFTIGNILTPKIMGDTLDLSPVVILISLLCWGLVWGFAGALLSVPIAVMIKIICEHIPRLRFIAKMMCSAKSSGSR